MVNTAFISHACIQSLDVLTKSDQPKTPVVDFPVSDTLWTFVRGNQNPLRLSNTKSEQYTEQR